MTKKWNQWYIKPVSKLLTFCLSMNAFLLELFNYQFIITSIFLNTSSFRNNQKRITIFNIILSNICLRKAGNIRPSNIYLRKARTTINYSQKNSSFFVRTISTPQILSSKHMNNNISLQFNIAS